MEALQRLIADAKKTYATGKYLPIRRQFITGEGYKYICVIVAAYLANFSELPKDKNFRYGLWAIDFYGIPKDVAQAFLSGWDSTEETFDLEDYTEDYGFTEEHGQYFYLAKGLVKELKPACGSRYDKTIKNYGEEDA